MHGIFHAMPLMLIKFQWNFDFDLEVIQSCRSLSLLCGHADSRSFRNSFALCYRPFNRRVRYRIYGCM